VNEVQGEGIMIANRNQLWWNHHGSKRPPADHKPWLSMIKEVEGLLPDLDMAINTVDDSRFVAPWQDVQRAMRI
jgi:hypothetical protein